MYYALMVRYTCRQNFGFEFFANRTWTYKLLGVTL